MKVPLVHQAQQGLLVREVRLGQLAQLVYQEDPDPKDLQDLLVKRVPQVRKARKAQLVVMVFRAQLDSQAQQVLLAPQEKTGIRARLENQARKEARVTKENRVHRVLLDHKVHLVNQVQLELMGSQVQEDNKASLVRKVMKVQEVSLVPQGQWACRVCLDHLVRREKQVMLDKWAHQVPLGPGVHPDHQERMVHKVLRVE